MKNNGGSIMSSKNRLIGEMVPGILMLGLVLVGVASGAAPHPKADVGQAAIEVAAPQPEAGSLTIQVLTEAGATLSATVLDENGICSAADGHAARRMRRSF